MSYKNYLNSSHWKKLRKKVLKRSKGICERKGCKREAKQVHHKVYKRLGNEKMTDVEALCLPCHLEEHPDKKFEMKRPLQARTFTCPACKSDSADLYVGSETLYFFCLTCGNPSTRLRPKTILAQKKGKQSERKKQKLKNRTCHICGKVLKNEYGKKQHVQMFHKYDNPSFEELEKERRERERKHALALKEKSNRDNIKGRTCHICKKVLKNQYGKEQHIKDTHHKLT